MAINNNSTINGTAESAAFTYDNLGRLVTSNQTSNGSSAQRRFAYDRWGNRTGVWDATSGGNKIQSIALQGSGGIPTNQIQSVTSGGTLNYAYDAAGNVSNDGAHAYTYDSENRIVSVDSGATASYGYDHQNRRYKKTIGSTITHYVWQGSQVLAEHNGTTGTVLTDYIFAGSRMIAKFGSTSNYFLSDRLSVRLSINTINGSVIGRQAHLPFGDDFAGSGTQDKHHFTSYERDESARDYAVNRQYDQFLGRFNRIDPYEGSYHLSNPQSLNRYSYAINDAVNAVDPLGLSFCIIYEVTDHREGVRRPIHYEIECFFTGGGGERTGTNRQQGDRGGGASIPCPTAEVDTVLKQMGDLVSYIEDSFEYIIQGLVGLGKSLKSMEFDPTARSLIHQLYRLGDNYVLKPDLYTGPIPPAGRLRSLFSTLGADVFAYLDHPGWIRHPRDLGVISRLVIEHKLRLKESPTCLRQLAGADVGFRGRSQNRWRNTGRKQISSRIRSVHSLMRYDPCS